LLLGVEVRPGVTVFGAQVAVGSGSSTTVKRRAASTTRWLRVRRLSSYSELLVEVPGVGGHDSQVVACLLERLAEPGDHRVPSLELGFEVGDAGTGT
jgi:hypothetical protein